MSVSHGVGGHKNRLAKAKSPYLLQHAENPVCSKFRRPVETTITILQVDWYEWGQEAFDKAKRENKPIFLSVSGGNLPGETLMTGLH